MIEKQETVFQSNTLFSCTGKVAGFLNHHVMLHPPRLARDYIFIVVPDTWKFHDNTGRGSISALPSATTPAKQPSTDPFDRAKFMSPSKRAPKRAATPTVTTALSTGQASHTELSSLTPCC